MYSLQKILTTLQLWARLRETIASVRISAPSAASGAESVGLAVSLGGSTRTSSKKVSAKSLSALKVVNLRLQALFLRVPTPESTAVLIGLKVSRARSSLPKAGRKGEPKK